MEAREEGEVIGFVRLFSGQSDPGGTYLRYAVPASALEQGAAFLPVLQRPTAVANFDGNDHIWSSPFMDGADFGIAAPPFTTFLVLGPQVGARLPVYNSMTGNYGWIGVSGIGPVASPGFGPA